MSSIEFPAIALLAVGLLALLIGVSL